MGGLAIAGPSGLLAWSENLRLLDQREAQLAKLQAETIKDSTYVGDRFVEETRAMHYGEKDAALIHGKADAQEARELLEEGISFAPLLIPFTPPEDAN